MSATLDRKHEQRMAHLDRANNVRTLQRTWKERIAQMPPAAARREAARVLREDPAGVGGLTIHQFLVAIPLIHDKKAQRMLTNRAEGWYIWPFRRVRELTPRQRERLAAQLVNGRAA